MPNIFEAEYGTIELVLGNIIEQDVDAIVKETSINLVRFVLYKPNTLAIFESQLSLLS